MNRIRTFPSERSVGMLSVASFSPDDQWVDLCEARGQVILPDGRDVRLFIDGRVDFDPNMLSAFDSDSLTVLEWVSDSQTITDEAISHIQHLSGLKGLALWETSLGDHGLSFIKHLSNLRWLDIGDTKVTDDGLAQLSDLVLLEELTLLNDHITDAGLRRLESLTALKRLDLMNTLVTDASVEILGSMTRLRGIRVFGTRITDAGYLKLKQALPDCQIKFPHPHFS